MPLCRIVLASGAAAVACGGTRAPGADAGLSADLSPPTLPDRLAATLSGPNTVALSWLASSDDRGVAGYQVFRDGAPLRAVQECAATDVGLRSLTRYCYTVAALDAAGNSSGHAGPACVTTLDGTSPSKPAGLSVSLTGPTAVALSWTASTDDVGVAGYRVYRDGMLLTTTLDPAFGDPQLAPATRHCYAVSAIDGAGNESERSDEACATALWNVQTVTCVPEGYFVGEPDLAIDSQGFVHLAFRGWNSTLEYATNRSGAWEPTLVKQGTTEAIASPHLALDSKDKAHIAYYSWVDFLTETRDLKYATSKDGAWVDATLDSAGNVGSPNSIATGPGDEVHISYADLTNGMLKYARGVAVRSVDVLGTITSNVIGVSPTGEVQVLYASSVYPYPIQHASLGVEPRITTVIGSTMVGNLPMLAFDASGAPWVGWRGNTALGYVSFDGSAWTGGSTGIDGIASRLAREHGRRTSRSSTWSTTWGRSRSASTAAGR